jgi:hypothetical protein
MRRRRAKTTTRRRREGGGKRGGREARTHQVTVGRKGGEMVAIILFLI